MRRLLLPGVLASLALAAFVGPVTARPPNSTASPPDSVDEFDAGVVCDFAVRLEGWSNERVVFGEDGNGNPRLVVTGNALTRVTNLDGDGSVVLGTGGRVVVTDPPDGTSRLHAGGRTLFFFFPGDANPVGEGHGLFLVIGRASQVLDLTANVVTSFEHQGPVRDICAELD